MVRVVAFTCVWCFPVVVFWFVGCLFGCCLVLGGMVWVVRDVWLCCVGVCLMFVVG